MGTMHFSDGKLVMHNGKFLNCCCDMGEFRVWYGYKSQAGNAAVWHVDVWYDPVGHIFIGGAGGGELVLSGCFGASSSPRWSYIVVTAGSGHLMQWGVRRTVGTTTTNILIGLLIDPIMAAKGTIWQLGSGNTFAVNCGGSSQNISVYIEKLTSRTWSL
jgi:hypothetical protein